jgi:choline-sulfatase
LASPNILFILSDQHAQHASGPYGDTAGVTPNLDALAAAGVTFDNVYCPSPICGPSRMSTMTGREPHELTCWLNGDVLNSGVPTIAHALGAVGYRSCLVGRMHFIGPDQTHGFLERYVGDHSANWPGNPTFDHGELRGTSGPDRISIEKSGAGTNAYDLKDRDTAAAAADWLDREAGRRAAGEDRPFFLTVGFMLPHPPYVADAEDFDAVAGRVPRTRVERSEPEHPWIAGWRDKCGISSLEPEDVSRTRQAYWGMVRRLDRLIGDVLEALERTGLARDTLVVYASDHGDHLGDRGLFWKHTFFDESAKVPLIMRWPEALPQGRRCTRVAGLIDIGATFAEAAGASWSGGGASLLAVARDPQADWRDEVTCEYCCGTADPWSFPVPTMNRMVRQGRYKLCYYHGHAPQLFDVEADPAELSDLGQRSEFAAIRDALLRRVLSDWDPDDVAARLVRREADAAILQNWARLTAPPEAHRWAMPDGMAPSLDRRHETGA